MCGFSLCLLYVCLQISLKSLTTPQEWENYFHCKFYVFSFKGQKYNYLDSNDKCKFCKMQKIG